MKLIYRLFHKLKLSNYNININKIQNFYNVLKILKKCLKNIVILILMNFNI